MKLLTCEKMADGTRCPNEGRWMPELRVRAPREVPGSHVFAPALLALAICDEHKKAAKPEEFIGDAGWKQIEQGFRTIGKAIPDRARTTLYWRRLNDPTRHVQQMVKTIWERQYPL